ncbi:hypothetical protein ABH920_007049 [Catenulispora sp. EB89]
MIASTGQFSAASNTASETPIASCRGHDCRAASNSNPSGARKTHPPDPMHKPVSTVTRHLVSDTAQNPSGVYPLGRCMVFVSRYARNPSGPNSRPSPDCLKPPNGELNSIPNVLIP